MGTSKVHSEAGVGWKEFNAWLEAYMVERGTGPERFLLRTLKKVITPAYQKAFNDFLSGVQPISREDQVALAEVRALVWDVSSMGNTNDGRAATRVAAGVLRTNEAYAESGASSGSATDAGPRL